MITEVQALLLAVLREQGKAHGHAMAKELEEMRGKPMGIGTLYKALHALERRGLVRGQWEDQPEAEYGRPRRRFYRITGVGERALKEYAAHIDSTRQLLRPRTGGALP